MDSELNKTVILLAMIMDIKMKQMARKILFLISIISFSLVLFAQAPTGIPRGEQEAVDFDLFNIILLIVLPVLLIIFYFWYRSRKNKK